MLLSELLGQVHCVFTNIVERCCNGPLYRFFCENFLRSNIFTLYITQKLFRRLTDIFTLCRSLYFMRFGFLWKKFSDIGIT